MFPWVEANFDVVINNSLHRYIPLLNAKSLTNRLFNDDLSFRADFIMHVTQPIDGYTERL